MNKAILSLFLGIIIGGAGVWVATHRHPESSAAEDAAGAEEEEDKITTSRDGDGNVVLHMSDDLQGDANIVVKNPEPVDLTNQGAALSGVIILRDSVVRLDRKGWVYLLNPDGESLTRKEVLLEHPTDEGWIVTRGIASTDHVVVGGAQTLLSDELMPASNIEEPEEDTTNLVSVQTATVKSVTLHRYAQAYAVVQPAMASSNSPAGALLASPVGGVVARIAVVEGQQVAKGDLVMALNSSTLTLESAEQEVARQKQLYAQQNTSLRSLQSAEAQLALLQVISPLAGTIVHINVNPGQAVDPTTIVAEIIDLNRLAVSVQIAAAEASEIQVGGELQVLADSPIKSSISFISPDVDKANGTVLVRALLPPGGLLRPGQFIPVRLTTAMHENALAAPMESIVTDEQGKTGISIVVDDEAELHGVKTGFKEGGLVEIEGGGIKAGDTVVTVGAYGLPQKKTKVQVVSPSP